MPLVRLSHTVGKPPAFSAALSQGVHRAMVATFNVPADDFFQIVTEHEAGAGIVGPKAFLDIAHTADLVFVQITCAEGRSTEQKKALYAGIVENLSAAPGVRREDVIINLVETRRENWSFGNGGAPYAG
jgi:phenylpyruvate tautomerase PptA (4-oxalocrotonate tautomerase family)